MRRIIVEKRTDDYKAYLDGCEEIWDRGHGIPEAIGNLIITHRNVFGIMIEEA